MKETYPVPAHEACFDGITTLICAIRLKVPKKEIKNDWEVSMHTFYTNLFDINPIHWN